MRRDDFELARRCVSGDREAQREFFQRERRRVHVILFRVLGSNSDMEDLLQEAFIEIFRSMPGFRGEAALGTWLDRIAVRVAYGHLSRRRLETVRLSLVPEPLSREPGADERASAPDAPGRRRASTMRSTASPCPSASPSRCTSSTAGPSNRSL